jgi:hypothetical protein
MGGALATIFGFYASADSRFAGDDRPPVDVFTFSAPWVGGLNFFEAFRHQELSRKIRLARFANGKDFGEKAICLSAGEPHFSFIAMLTLRAFLLLLSAACATKCSMARAGNKLHPCRGRYHASREAWSAPRHRLQQQLQELLVHVFYAYLGIFPMESTGFQTPVSSHPWARFEHGRGNEGLAQRGEIFAKPFVSL